MAKVEELERVVCAQSEVIDTLNEELEWERNNAIQTALFLIALEQRASHVINGEGDMVVRVRAGHFINLKSQIGKALEHEA